MNFDRLILLIFLVAAPVNRVLADVIYLKNGMYLKLRGAKEKDGQIE